MWLSAHPIQSYLFGGRGDIVTATGRHKSMVLVSAMFGKHRVDGHRYTRHS